jgi:hypothetical protein
MGSPAEILLPRFIQKQSVASSNGPYLLPREKAAFLRSRV